MVSETVAIESGKLLVCATCATIASKLDVLNYVIYALIAVVLIDLFFIWRRCNRQKTKIQDLRRAVKGKDNADGA